MLNLVEFQEYAIEHIREFLSEDMKDAIIEQHVVDKNNGVRLHALNIRQEGTAVSPNIYLEALYDRYVEGDDIDVLLQTVADRVEQKQQVEELNDIAVKYQDFDYVKDKIIMTVVNAEKNRERLAEMPHVLKDDLAIIYKVVVTRDEEGIGTIGIQNSHLENWGMDAKLLHELAVENSKRIMPPSVKTMNEVLIQMMGGLEQMDPAMAMMFQEELPADKQMYIVTNTSGINGASTMFYSDVLDQVAEKLGSDVYVLPSSVHECIVISAKEGSPEELEAMVQEVNESQVVEEEQLSDHVYHYDPETRSLTLAEEHEKSISAGEYSMEGNPEIAVCEQSVQYGSATQDVSRPRHHR